MKKIYSIQHSAKVKILTINTLLFLLFMFSSFLTRGGVISGTFTTLADCPIELSAMAVDPATGYFYAVEDQDGGVAYYRYSAASNTWTTLAAPPHETGNNAGATFLNGKIYISYTEYDDLAVYTIATDSWATITGPTDGTNTGNISNDGTNIYVACGGEPGNFWRYNVAAATWTALAQVLIAEE